MHLVILGCGYSGTEIAKDAVATGATVVGTARAEDKLQLLQALGIRGQIFDGAALTPRLAAELAQATHIVQSIPPGTAGDPLLKLAAGRLHALCPKLEWIGYLSTVGVYGDHGGGWVTEQAPCEPKPGRSQERVDAESAWLAEGEATGLPVAVLRLAGIYGPGRNALVNLTKGTARRIIKPGQVFNRIRVEDIAGSALFLTEARMGGVFNIADNEPAPPQDVVTYAAMLMGVEPPPEYPFKTADMTPMARSFYSANKKVSNRRIINAGYRFRFPEYRMSLADLWSSGRWQG